MSYQLLNQACQEAAAWPPDLGQAPYMSVNLAAGQLHQPGLVGHIAQILDHTSMPPQRLQLEITEQTIIDPAQVNKTDIAATLSALDRLGIRLAVDDFGTGYSNLTRLRDLPVSRSNSTRPWQTRSSPRSSPATRLSCPPWWRSPVRSGPAEAVPLLLVVIFQLTTAPMVAGTLGRIAHHTRGYRADRLTTDELAPHRGRADQRCSADGSGQAQGSGQPARVAIGT